VCKEIRPELIEFELSSRVLARKLIDDYQSVFQNHASLSSAEAKKLQEARVWDFSDPWVRGVTLAELIAAINIFVPARLKVWMEHDAVAEVSRKLPTADHSLELAIQTSSKDYDISMKQLQVAREKWPEVGERTVFFDDENCQEILRMLSTRSDALAIRTKEATVAAQTEIKAKEKADEARKAHQQLAEQLEKAREVARLEEEKARKIAAANAKKYGTLMIVQLLSVPLQPILMIREFGWSVLWFSPPTPSAGWTFWVIVPLANVAMFGYLLFTKEEYDKKAGPNRYKAKK